MDSNANNSDVALQRKFFITDSWIDKHGYIAWQSNSVSYDICAINIYKPLMFKKGLKQQAYRGSSPFKGVVTQCRTVRQTATPLQNCIQVHALFYCNFDNYFRKGSPSTDIDGSQPPHQSTMCHFSFKHPVPFPGSLYGITTHSCTCNSLNRTCSEMVRFHSPSLVHYAHPNKTSER